MTALVKGAILPFYHRWQWLRYRGTGRWCPVCERSARRFAPGNSVIRAEVRCIHCGSFRRQRFAWLYLNEHTDLFDGTPRSMLHVAPERCLEPILRERLGAGYLTADYLDPRAMVRMDITDIHYPDASFDAIYCSHVLEHVSDDRKALREFRRVLKPQGWALIMVPINAEKTFEDPAIVDPAERLRVFGQKDHVRKYAPDFVERVREAGLDVQVLSPGDLYPADQIEHMGLGNLDDIYFCRRA